MIRFEKVQKNYGKKTILKDFSVSIDKGESIGVIGPNGAGKSTFLKIAASVQKPDKGIVFYDDVPLKKLIKTYRQDIGYIPQDIALYEELTVREQIKFWKSVTNNKVNESYLSQMISMLHLDQVMEQRVRNLSGGWKRKVNLCVGMLHEPPIIMLDEPTVGIDIAAKADIINWLKVLNDLGTTVIYISHDWHELKQLSNRVFIIDQGQIAYEGSMEGLEDFERELELGHGQEELTKIIKQRH